MTEHVQIVVVGGGIVGASVLYNLAKVGLTDSLLIEKRELTSGSTWHAAGNVTFFGHYPSITQLYTNSVKVYLEASEESGQSVGFHAAGSLRLATSEDERAAYEKLIPMYDEIEVPYEVVDNDRIRELHPLLNTEGLHGAASTPTDGHCDASGATHALAIAARARGASIRRQCPVTSIAQEPGGQWRVATAQGDVICEQLVLAASFWTRELADQIGLQLPLYALEHHEVVTQALPELESLGFEVPTVRDPWAPSNTRQEGHGFLCGVYESHPKPWSVDGIPPDFAEELLVPDLDRLESHLGRVMQRIPAFADAGIKVVNNGPICYTPDGCPLLGPVDGHHGLWLASGFCVGIGTGGGSGEFLANWMHAGEPPYDLPIVYPSRFSNQMTRAQAIEQIVRTYRAGYTIPS